MNQYLVYSVVKVLCVIFAALLPMVAYSVYVERKVSAFIQDRVGPNRVGPFGLLQPVVDIFKLILKEDYSPGHVRKSYFWLAPAVGMIPSFLAVAVIPFGSTLGNPNNKMVIADLNVGVLYTFGIISLAVYGIVMAGYAANSKYPFLGGIRSSAQMISYELSLGMSVVPLFMLVADPAFDRAMAGATNGWREFLAGTSGLNLNRVVAYQSASILDWLIFKQPLAFVLFLIAAFAETNRLPFDLPEAETELVGGYHTEYGSMKFGLFFLGEYASMIAGSGLIVTLFLGGWTLPFGELNRPVASLGVGLAQIAIFLAKVGVLLMVMIWVRWMWPRFRFDQLMGLGWKRFIPLALANIFVTAVWLWLRS
jgi:NADH-quinone oxidoreductase subunit H